MEKVIMDKWYKNKEKLRHYLMRHKQEEYYEYNWLFHKILNYVLIDFYIEEVKEVGSYQGDIYFTISDKEGNIYKGEVSYGSCSVCDTLISIHNYELDDFPDSEQIEEYMNLCLYILESFKKS